MINDFWSCGCGGKKADEDEVERVVREVEEERKAQPVVIPVKKEAPIPAPDVFTKRREKVTVTR